MPLELSFFLIPGLLHQIIPNRHNRILTPLHAILHLRGYNHTPTHPKRPQNAPQSRAGHFLALACACAYTRAFIPGAVEYSIKQYHIQPPPAEQKRAPKTPARHPKQENTSAERRPPAGSTDRKKRAAARGGKESRPAAYVPGRTAGRRRPAAAAVPGLHALTIRQTAADADRGQPKSAKTKNFTKSSGKSFAND